MMGPPLAVTIRGFHTFIDEHGGRDKFHDKTTADVVKTVLKSFITRHGGDEMSFVEYMRKHHPSMVRAADWYVSHAWRDKFLDTVDALTEFSHEQRSSSDDDVAFWFCVFYNDQFAMRRSDSSSDTLLATFEECLVSTGKIVMVMHPWNQPITLTRLWCVYEVFVAERRGIPFQAAMGKAPKEKLYLDIVRDDRENKFDKMRTAINSMHTVIPSSDSKNATATETRDHVLIRRAIQDTGTSFGALDELVNGVLSRWVVSAVEDRIKQDQHPLVAANFMLARAKASLSSDFLGARQLFLDEVSITSKTLGATDLNVLSAVKAYASLQTLDPAHVPMWNSIDRVVHAYREIFGGMYELDTIEMGMALIARDIDWSLYEKAKAALDQLLPHITIPEHLLAAMAMAVRVHLKLFDFEASAAVASDLIALHCQFDGMVSLASITARTSLAAASMQLQKFPHAIELYLVVFELAARAYGKHSWEAIENKLLLVEAYIKAGDNENAYATANDLATLCMNRDLPDHRIPALRAVAMCRVVAGQYASAFAAYKEAFECSVAEMGPLHLETRQLYCRLYMLTCHLARGQLPDAVALYNPSLESKSSRTGKRTFHCSMCGDDSRSAKFMQCQVCCLDILCQPCVQSGRAGCSHKEYVLFQAPELATADFQLLSAVASPQVREVLGRLVAIAASPSSTSDAETEHVVADAVIFALENEAARSLLPLIWEKFPTVRWSDDQIDQFVEIMITEDETNRQVPSFRVAGLNFLFGHVPLDLIVALLTAQLSLVGTNSTAADHLSSHHDGSVVVQDLLLECLGNLTTEITRSQEAVWPSERDMTKYLEKATAGAQATLWQLLTYPLYILYAAYATNAGVLSSRSPGHQALAGVFRFFATTKPEVFGGEAWVGLVCSACDASLCGNVGWIALSTWYCRECAEKRGVQCAVAPLGRFLVTPTHVNHGFVSPQSCEDFVAYCKEHHVCNDDLALAVRHFNTDTLVVPQAWVESPVDQINQLAAMMEFRLRLTELVISEKHVEVSLPVLHDTGRISEELKPHVHRDIRQKWIASWSRDMALIHWSRNDLDSAINLLVDAATAESTTLTPRPAMLTLLYEMVAKSPSALSDGVLDVLAELVTGFHCANTSEWMGLSCQTCEENLRGPLLLCTCCDQLGVWRCNACMEKAVMACQHPEYTTRLVVPVGQFVLERQLARACHAQHLHDIDALDAAYRRYCDANCVPVELRLSPVRFPGVAACTMSQLSQSYSHTSYLTSVDCPVEKFQREQHLAMVAYASDSWFKYYAMYCSYQRYCDSHGVARDSQMPPHRLPQHEIARIESANAAVVAAYNKSATCAYWRATLFSNFRQLRVLLGLDHEATKRTLDVFIDCLVGERQWELLLRVLDLATSPSSTYAFDALDLAVFQEKLDESTKYDPLLAQCQALSVARFIGQRKRNQDFELLQCLEFKRVGRKMIKLDLDQAPDPAALDPAWRQTRVAGVIGTLVQCCFQAGYIYTTRRNWIDAIANFEEGVLAAINSDGEVLFQWMYRLWHLTDQALSPRSLDLMNDRLTPELCPTFTLSEVERWPSLFCDGECGRPIEGTVFECDDCDDINTTYCSSCWVKDGAKCGHTLVPIAPPCRLLLERQAAASGRDWTAYQQHCDVRSVPLAERANRDMFRLTAPGPPDRLKMERTLCAYASFCAADAYLALFCHYAQTYAENRRTAWGQHPSMRPHEEFAKETMELLLALNIAQAP